MSVLIVIVIIFISLGTYYLTIGNASGAVFTGTLVSSSVLMSSSCNKNSCSSSYYVTETFQKGDSTNTCTITRLIPYYFWGDANNVAIHKKLGTQRKIWTTYYDAGSCYDQSIRTYYTIVGGILLGFGCFIILLIVFYFGIETIIQHHKDLTTNVQRCFGYDQV